ncbi:MAG: L,D-transpeptidase, partial [Myxococcota bacterium]
MEGVWVPAGQVRIAHKEARPAGVPSDAKWVHFNLRHQTMVAYEGDTPVYATLISSGKEGHDTPTGLFRTQRKYVSTTMRGRDPIEGTYHVEEVPWTLFYHGAYAVHGAYWHDTFGNVRSHGCTNLSVTDSRWLFHWEDYAVPDGWHGAIPASDDDRRSFFYFSR